MILGYKEKVAFFHITGSEKPQKDILEEFNIEFLIVHGRCVQ